MFGVCGGGEVAELAGVGGGDVEGHADLCAYRYQVLVRDGGEMKATTPRGDGRRLG